MVFSVIIYSPDDHIEYDLTTLDEIGLGGGATARIRMAHALAARGHTVDLYINCPHEKRLENVNYHHFTSFKDQHADIFIASSSGGNFSLAKLHFLPLNNIANILLIEGNEFPRCTEYFNFDHYYVLSNFVRNNLISKQRDNHRFFVTNHGIQKIDFVRDLKINDPYKLAFASHPSKGLKSAIKVLEQLRIKNKRFELHIFGDNRLWGDKLVDNGLDYPHASGIVYHGLIGQKKLAKELMACGFYIALQTRLEPFGIIIGEAQFAGCIVMASPVGAIPELINSGLNGFLIDGNPEDFSTINKCVSKIFEIMDEPNLMKKVKIEGEKTPIDWSDCAEAWESHWKLIKDHHDLDTSFNQVCKECGGQEVLLKDGNHCLDCGRFRK